MASVAFIIRHVVVVLIVASVSHTSSHRLSNHPFLKGRTETVWSPTTQQSTASVVIDDKQQGPSVKYPPAGQSFLDYLVNRGTYFDKVGSVNNNTKSPPTQLTISRTSDPITRLQQPETTTTRKTSTESTRTTATTSTTTATTSTTTATTSTTTATTSKASTINPNLMPFYGDPQAKTQERRSRFQLADLWLQRFRRPSILEPAQSRSRSNDVGSSNTTSGNSSVLPASQSPSNGNQGIVEIASNGGVYIVNNKQTSTAAVGDKMAVTQPTTAAVGDKMAVTRPTTVDVQDKPFYGSSLGQYFDDDRSAGNGANYSQRNKTANEPRGRRRRATDVALGNDTACADPRQFQPCQYYSQCFREVADSCSSRDSFLGNVFSRFCSRTVETSKSARSQLLTSYLTGVQLCLRNELVNIVEYPSCADVTRTVQDSLFTKRPSSCLFQRATFCEVLEDEVARPGLARMFNSTNDAQFMFRVMVNIGNLASYCRGQGASIFVTDITLLATANDSPYKHLVGRTPIPGIVPKN